MVSNLFPVAPKANWKSSREVGTVVQIFGIRSNSGRASGKIFPRKATRLYASRVCARSAAPPKLCATAATEAGGRGGAGPVCVYQRLVYGHPREDHPTETARYPDSGCRAILELWGRYDVERIPLLYRITKENGEVLPQNQLYFAAN